MDLNPGFGGRVSCGDLDVGSGGCIGTLGAGGCAEAVEVSVGVHVYVWDGYQDGDTVD